MLVMVILDPWIFESERESIVENEVSNVRTKNAGADDGLWTTFVRARLMLLKKSCRGVDRWVSFGREKAQAWPEDDASASKLAITSACRVYVGCESFLVTGPAAFSASFLASFSTDS